MIETVELCNGKYIVQLIDNGSEFKVLRNGKDWRNLDGDKLFLEMFYKIQELEGTLIQVYEEALNNGCDRNRIIDRIDNYIK